MIRELTPADKVKAKCIWNECFSEDSPEFIDWYFDKIFDVGFGYFTDDELVSMLCVTKRKMRVRGVDMPCAVIQGVGTLSEYRHKGYSRQVMEYALNALKSEFPIAMLTTFVPKLYTGMGFATYLRTGLERVNEYTNAQLSYERELTYGKAEEYAEFYCGGLDNMSGWLLRTADDFLNKQIDQTRFAGEMLVRYEREGELAGYAFVADRGSKLYISEAIGEGRKLADNESRECAMICATQKGELYSMIRVLDFERAFEAVSIPPRELTVYISDNILSDNENAWHLYSAGGRTRIVQTAADPEEELDISDASALLVGATETFAERFNMYYMPRMQLESY